MLYKQLHDGRHTLNDRDTKWTAGFTAAALDAVRCMGRQTFVVGADSRRDGILHFCQVI